MNSEFNIEDQDFGLLPGSTDPNMITLQPLEPNNDNTTMSQSLPWSPETTFDTDSNVPTEYADESSGYISLQFGNSDIMEFNSINEFIELDHSNVSYEQDLAVVSPLPPQPDQKTKRSNRKRKANVRLGEINEICAPKAISTKITKKIAVVNNVPALHEHDYTQSKPPVETNQKGQNNSNPIIFDESYEALGTWRKKICARPTVSSKKASDAYIITPDKKKLRSSNELLNYLSENPKYWPVINPRQINFDKEQTEKIMPNTKKIIKFLEEVNKGVDCETVLASLKDSSKSKPKIISCDFENNGVICGMIFAKPHELMAHKLSHKNSGRLFQCGNCQLKFSDIINLRNHVKNESCIKDNSNDENQDSLTIHQGPVIQKLPEKNTKSELTPQVWLKNLISLPEVGNVSLNLQDPVIQKLPEKYKNEIEKIRDNTSNMINRFDVTTVSTADQDTVNQKLSNTATSQIKTVDYFVESINCDFKNNGVICGMTFAQSHELLAHKLSHKKSGRLFQCGNCQLNFSDIINLTKHVKNERKCQDPVVQKLPEKNTSYVEKIADDTSNVASKFDVTTESTTDQDTETQKISQIETMDSLVGNIIHNQQEDPVIQILPEKNTNDVEKIADDTSNMSNKFDVTSINIDQEAVTHKLSNTIPSQIETLECLDVKINPSHQNPVIQKLPETNTNDVEKIADDTSNMASEFDVTDQDAVTQKLSNTVPSQIETLECLDVQINPSHQNPVIQKLPETNTNDVEKIKDDTSNMASELDFITLQMPSGKSLLKSKILCEAARAENVPKASNSSEIQNTKLAVYKKKKPFKPAKLPLQTLPITNEAVSLKPKNWVRPTKKVEPEIEELSESVPITKDIVEDERPDKLSKGQKFSKAISIDLNSSKNQEPMKQKITKDNLTSEKQDCSIRNPLPQDTTMNQKSHDKNKISKFYWLNCRLCPFKSRKEDLMIEHMCSSHI